MRDTLCSKAILVIRNNTKDNFCDISDIEEKNYDVEYFLWRNREDLELWRRLNESETRMLKSRLILSAKLVNIKTVNLGYQFKAQLLGKTRSMHGWYLLPPYSKNGIVLSFCAKYGGLNEYLYSKRRWTNPLLALTFIRFGIKKECTNNITIHFIFASDVLKTITGWRRTASVGRESAFW